MVATVVVEDGTGVDPTANSYITVDYARQYNTDRGIDFPAEETPDDVPAIPQLIRAMDYLESMSFIGEPAFAVQPLSWPRRYTLDDGGTYIVGIPVNVKRALARLTQLAATVDYYQINTGFGIKSEKIGPLETVYDTGIGTNGTPRLDEIDSLLGPYVDAQFQTLMGMRG